MHNKSLNFTRDYKDKTFQAPGGHNVIAGIFDFIKKLSKESVLIGFLDGPQGIYNGQYCVIDDSLMDAYRNSGGT